MDYEYKKIVKIAYENITINITLNNALPSLV